MGYFESGKTSRAAARGRGISGMSRTHPSNRAGRAVIFRPGGCAGATGQQPQRFSNLFRRFVDRGIFFTAETCRGWANLVFETFRGWGWVRATPSHPHTPATGAAQARTGEGSRQKPKRKPPLILRFCTPFCRLIPPKCRNSSTGVHLAAIIHLVSKLQKGVFVFSTYLFEKLIPTTKENE